MLNTFTALVRINYHTFCAGLEFINYFFFIFENVLNFQAESELESDSGISINLSHFDTDLASQVLFYQSWINHFLEIILSNFLSVFLFLLLLLKIYSHTLIYLHITYINGVVKICFV